MAVEREREGAVRLGDVTVWISFAPVAPCALRADGRVADGAPAWAAALIGPTATFASAPEKVSVYCVPASFFETMMFPGPIVLRPWSAFWTVSALLMFQASGVVVWPP